MNVETADQPRQTFKADSLPVRVYASQAELARDVAQIAHDYLRSVIESKGSAAAILATGNSQIEFLHALIALGAIDWSKVTLFHMDEYLGIDANHPASFRRYMRERVESRLHPKVFNYLTGDAPLPLDECERYTTLLKAQPIDLCCLGIGENGHLAFNDPPVANFQDRHLVKLVQLDLRPPRTTGERGTLSGYCCSSAVCFHAHHSSALFREANALRGAGKAESERGARCIVRAS